MGLVIRIITIVAVANLTACAPKNSQPVDDALSSTQEVTKATQIPELQNRANFNSPVKGIYLSQATIEDRAYLNYIINRSKESGINTFVIDLHSVTSNYEKNMLLVRNSGIKYVARVVVFPVGTNNANFESEAYWLSRYRLVDAAIRLGADHIQLDLPNREDMQNVLTWFEQKIAARAKLQTEGTYPFIELSNNHEDFAEDQLAGYIHNQIKAVEDANAEGWYAWSTGNRYDRLFYLLQEA